MHLPRGRTGLVGAIALGGILAVVAGGLFVLASGDGDGRSDSRLGSGSTATPEMPQLTAQDLPGDGWMASETELVSLDDSPGAVFAIAPDLAECAGLQAFEATLFEHQAAFVSGASRLFERALPMGVCFVSPASK